MANAEFWEVTQTGVSLHMTSWEASILKAILERVGGGVRRDSTGRFDYNESRRAASDLLNALATVESADVDGNLFDRDKGHIAIDNDAT